MPPAAQERVLDEFERHQPSHAAAEQHLDRQIELTREKTNLVDARAMAFETQVTLLMAEKRTFEAQCTGNMRMLIQEMTNAQEAAALNKSSQETQHFEQEQFLIEQQIRVQEMIGSNSLLERKTFLVKQNSKKDRDQELFNQQMMLQAQKARDQQVRDLRQQELAQQLAAQKQVTLQQLAAQEQDRLMTVAQLGQMAAHADAVRDKSRSHVAQVNRMNDDGSNSEILTQDQAVAPVEPSNANEMLRERMTEWRFPPAKAYRGPRSICGKYPYTKSHHGEYFRHMSDALQLFPVTEETSLTQDRFVALLESHYLNEEDVLAHRDARQDLWNGVGDVQRTPTPEEIVPLLPAISEWCFRTARYQEEHFIMMRTLCLYRTLIPEDMVAHRSAKPELWQAVTNLEDVVDLLPEVSLFVAVNKLIQVDVNDAAVISDLPMSVGKLVLNHVPFPHKMDSETYEKIREFLENIVDNRQKDATFARLALDFLAHPLSRDERIVALYNVCRDEIKKETGFLYHQQVEETLRNVREQILREVFDGLRENHKTFARKALRLELELAVDERQLQLAFNERRRLILHYLHEELRERHAFKLEDEQRQRLAFNERRRLILHHLHEELRERHAFKLEDEQRQRLANERIKLSLEQRQRLLLRMELREHQELKMFKALEKKRKFEYDDSIHKICRDNMHQELPHYIKCKQDLKDLPAEERKAEWRRFRAFYQQEVNEPLNRFRQEKLGEFTRSIEQYDRQLAELKDRYESQNKAVWYK